MGQKTIALLRGINVGGKNLLAMSDLVKIFEELDCKEVSTFIQSGNVIFEASSSILKTLELEASRLIKKRKGLEVPVILRNQKEMKEAVARNPYLKFAKDLKPLYVAFLQSKPGPEELQSLDPKRSPGDEYSVLGKEIYLHFKGGAAKTKLTNAYFDSKLKTVSTMRNWNTTLKLLSLCS